MSDIVLESIFKKVAKKHNVSEKLVKELWESQNTQFNSFLTSIPKQETESYDKIKLSWIGSFAFNKPYYDKLKKLKEEKSAKNKLEDNS